MLSGMELVERLSFQRTVQHSGFLYRIELAVAENTLLAFEPMTRSVPTTITKMTASITAYSAMPHHRP